MLKLDSIIIGQNYSKQGIEGLLSAKSGVF
jgi:hypothetical protein